MSKLDTFVFRFKLTANAAQKALKNSGRHTFQNRIGGKSTSPE
jgi:hypothetical protein